MHLVITILGCTKALLLYYVWYFYYSACRRNTRKRRYSTYEAMDHKCVVPCGKKKRSFTINQPHGRIQNFNLGRESSGRRPRGGGASDDTPPQCGRVWKLKGTTNVVSRGWNGDRWKKEGFPCQPVVGSGERRELPSEVRDEDPTANGFHFQASQNASRWDNYFQAYATACVDLYLLNLGGGDPGSAPYRYAPEPTALDPRAQ